MPRTCGVAIRLELDLAERRRSRDRESTKGCRDLRGEGARSYVVSLAEESMDAMRKKGCSPSYTGTSSSNPSRNVCAIRIAVPILSQPELSRPAVSS